MLLEGLGTNTFCLTFPSASLPEDSRPQGLHDAIAGVQAKVIEVHISNIHKREEFRRNSYIAPVAIGQVIGFGIAGYGMALNYILDLERMNDK